MGGATRAVWLTNAQIAAFRSLAASRNLEFADVVAAAEDGRPKDVIEMRDFGRERRITEQSVARINALYRQKVLGILMDRNLWLRDREL
jgi:hypothetical protein